MQCLTQKLTQNRYRQKFETIKFLEKHGRKSRCPSIG